MQSGCNMRLFSFMAAILACQHIHPAQSFTSSQACPGLKKRRTKPDFHLRSIASPTTRLLAASSGGGTGRNKNENDHESHEDNLHLRPSSHHLHHHPQHRKNQHILQDGWDSSERGKNMTAYYEKQIQVLKARSKIDRILNGPNPPLDMEAELQKVVSIAPPSPQLHLQNPADLKLEERIMQLEAEIRQAVKHQDYDAAAQASHEIGQMHVDDCGAVLQVNAQYYKAFSQKDYQQMANIWWNDNTATCIHPSQKPLVGSKSVMNSWRKMFDSHAGAFQKSILEPHNIRISVKGATTAVVTCDEHVYARRFVRGQQRETVLVNKLTATNIFRKCGSKWYITHHHASWHADSQAAKNALSIRGNGGGVHPQSSDKAAVRYKDRLRPSSFLNEDDDEDDADDDDEYVDDWSNGIDSNKSHQNEDGNERTGDPSMDGILGIPGYGPILGDGKKEDSKKVKGVLMGSLNDILGNGLGDILGGSDSNNNGNQPNKPIIRIARINGKNVGGSSISDALNLDEELLDAYDDENGDDEEDGEDREEEEKSSKVSIRQKCILALRKLNSMGAISPRQKRLLLTDIISHSSKGEVSMVETAFELLCSSDSSANEAGEVSDEAQEEFADQCRVIASTL